MYHTIIIAGNLGRDPEMRYTQAGQAVTSFSVATNRQYTNGKGETIKETLWFRVTAWGNQAEVCNKYLSKGSKVLVEGRLVGDQDTGGPKIWQGNDGQSKASFEINASTVRFLSSRTDSTAQQDGAINQMEMDQSIQDDIPF